MKKSWIFLTLLSSTLSVQAQFHTLTTHKSLYKAYEVPRRIETKNFPESGEADSPVSQAKTIEKRKKAARNRWIGRYLSVSYPLKQIQITSRFGQRRDPFTGRKNWHNGLDLRARNEEVYAMMTGEVIKVSSDRNSGNYIVIRHGGYTVSYCHLSKTMVRKGDQVKPGEVVAVSGKTGRATGYHLHITARYGKRYIDPAILLQFVKEIQDEALSHLRAN